MGWFIGLVGVAVLFGLLGWAAGRKQRPGDHQSMRGASGAGEKGKYPDSMTPM